MDFNIKLSPEANIDIYKALDWYDDIRTELSVDFYQIVFGYLEFISSNPFIYPVKYKNIRVFPIHKFPYIICYFVDKKNEIINVIAVFNTNQDPEKWQSRVEG